MKRIEAILFDSDGVLVDTERLFFEATQAAFHAAGATLSPIQWATWYLAEGRRSRDIAEIVGIPPSRIDQVVGNRDRLFWSRVDQGVPLLPGVTDTLRNLAGNFRLAVVTGASRRHYDRVHASSGLQGFFEATITTDEYKHGKPHPEAYVTALKKLSLEPHQCLAVEDSPRGAKAARAAGIRCVVVPTALTDLPQCPADCDIIENLALLGGLLESYTRSADGPSYFPSQQ